MEKISEFLIEHWITILIINIIAIVFIIIYLIGQKKSEKKTKYQKKDFNNSNLKNDKKSIIKDNISLDNNQIHQPKQTYEDKIYKNSNNENSEQNIIEKIIETNDKNIQEFNAETKQQISDNIDKIINQSNSVFEEFEKIVPEEKIISDEIKEELESFEDDIKPIKKIKKNEFIDTDIELPKIELTTKEEDIWS